MDISILQLFANEVQTTASDGLKEVVATAVPVPFTVFICTAIPNVNIKHIIPKTKLIDFLFILNSYLVIFTGH